MNSIDKYSYARKNALAKNDKNNPQKINKQNKLKLPNIYEKKNFNIRIEKCSVLQMNKPDYGNKKDIIDKIPEKCIVEINSKNS